MTGRAGGAVRETGARFRVSRRALSAAAAEAAFATLRELPLTVTPPLSGA